MTDTNIQRGSAARSAKKLRRAALVTAIAATAPTGFLLSATAGSAGRFDSVHNFFMQIVALFAFSTVVLIAASIWKQHAADIETALLDQARRTAEPDQAMPSAEPISPARPAGAPVYGPPQPARRAAPERPWEPAVLDPAPAVASTPVTEPAPVPAAVAGA